jgi:glutaredoxin
MTRHAPSNIGIWPMPHEKAVTPSTQPLPQRSQLAIRGLLVSCVLSASFLASGSAHAEVYKWKDANGQINFSDQNIGHPTAKTVTIKINSYDHVSYTTALKSLQLPASNSVVLYGTTWCGYCKKARQYFQKTGIAFTEYDVEKSAKGKSDYHAMQGNGVPIILVGEKRMNGFSEDGFQNIYTKK